MGVAMSSRSDQQSNVEALANQVTETFVHRLFPSYRDPSFLACPDDEIAAITLDAVTRPAESKGSLRRSLIYDHHLRMC